MVARAVVNTLVGCCTAGMVVLFVNKLLPGGKWSIVKLINGCLAGMVSVCAGCDGYYPWAAAAVSGVAGALYVVISKLVISIKVDDPLDAVAVHAGSGLWGILAAPIFMENGKVLRFFKLYSIIVLCRHHLHWIPVRHDDVGLERGCCWQFHCMERIVRYFAVWAAEGIL